MPSNNSKYSEEMREQTAKLIIESGKSATSMAEDLGIDTNTVCRWVRDYRRVNNCPTYAQAKGFKKKKKKNERELLLENKELERQLKKQRKELEDEKEKVEILKKSLHIFMQAQG
jgi:transposase